MEREGSECLFTYEDKFHHWDKRFFSHEEINCLYFGCIDSYDLHDSYDLLLCGKLDCLISGSWTAFVLSPGLWLFGFLFFVIF